VLVWLVECKKSLQRFAVKPREKASGKSTEALAPNPDVGTFECPLCHDVHRYGTEDFIPGEGRII